MCEIVEKDILFDILKQSSQGMYVVKILFDEKKKPKDWTIVYCNDEVLKICGLSKNQMIGHPFLIAYPHGNTKWLKSYYEAACNHKTLEFDEYSSEICRYIHLKIIPTNHDGYCFVLISRTREDANRFANDESNDETERTRILLDALSIDYTSVIMCDLLKDSFEVVKMTPFSYSAFAMQELKQKTSFTELFHYFWNNYVIQQASPDYLDVFSKENLMEVLKKQDTIDYRHTMVPNHAGNQFFHAKIALMNQSVDHFQVLIGMRPIDDIVRQEHQNQLVLQKAFEEATRNVEIISALSTFYKEIAVVNLKEETYMVVSGPQNSYIKNGRVGDLDELKQLLFSKNVSDEFHQEIEEFINFETLAERLHDKKAISKDLKSRNGAWYCLNFIVKKRDSEGNVTHVLMAVNDIDEKKKQELEYQERLHSTMVEAERANNAKTSFLRRMSHDIRTPINGIRGMLEIAEYYKEDPNKQEECREKIWQSTNHLQSLVSDVLDMNKLESGTVIIKNEPFRLKKVLKEVNAVSEAQAEEHGVTFISKDIDGVEHDCLIGSAVYLKRILLNFTSNAIKYNKTDGKVIVSGKEISFDGHNAVYEFVCEDNGIGMSEEFQKHAFEMFTQEDKTKARTNYEGTGLGLTISKQLTELLGGTLQMQSIEDVGTRIRVRIPFEVDQNNHKQHEETVDMQFDGMSALVVEDNEVNAEIASFLLEKHNIQVTVVENGQMAVDCMQETSSSFDMIFMDIMMPVLNGLEATKIIREFNPDIPIFAMTANAFADDIQQSLDVGMNAHLTKPLQEEEMMKVIQKYRKV